jgi:four helix bundle protein
MGAKTYEDLVAWKLSAQLRDEIVALTATPALGEDLDFRNQLRTSSSSAPANLAEGFGRYRHADFARFARIARGSLLETQNHLDDARKRGYVTCEQFDALHALSRRAVAATSRLLRYLDNSPTP